MKYILLFCVCMKSYCNEEGDKKVFCTIQTTFNSKKQSMYTIDDCLNYTRPLVNDRIARRTVVSDSATEVPQIKNGFLSYQPYTQPKMTYLTIGDNKKFSASTLKIVDAKFNILYGTDEMFYSMRYPKRTYNKIEVVTSVQDDGLYIDLNMKDRVDSEDTQPIDGDTQPIDKNTQPIDKNTQNLGPQASEDQSKQIRKWPDDEDSSSDDEE